MSNLEKLISDIKTAIKESREGYVFKTWFQDSLPPSINLTEVSFHHLPEGYNITMPRKPLWKIPKVDVEAVINFNPPIESGLLNSEDSSYQDLIRIIEQIYKEKEHNKIFDYLKDRISKVKIEDFDVKALGDIMEHTGIPPTKLFMNRSRNLLKILKFFSEFQIREDGFITIVSGLGEKEFITGVVEKIKIQFSEPQIRIDNNRTLIKSSFIVYEPPSRLKELVLVDFSNVQ